MSDNIYSYLDQSETAWLRHEGVRQSATGWHFCFPRLAVSPASQTRLYYWGAVPNLNQFSHLNESQDIYRYWRPSTEQFFGGNSQTRMPPGHVVAVGGSLVCLSNGRLITTDFAAGSAVDRQSNILGLGPTSAAAFAASSFTADAYGVLRNRKQVRNSCTVLFGKTGELEGVRFVSVNAHPGFTSAVDDTGAIWFCGGEFTGEYQNIANGSAFERDKVLAYPSKITYSEYEDASGTQTLDIPIHATKLASSNSGNVTYSTPTYLLDEDGNLYLWKAGFPPIPNVVVPDRWFLVKGFVNSITLTNGGSGYTGTPTLTVSAPDSQYGTRPTFAVTVSGGAVTGVELLESGWGYSSPPTLTFSGGGGSGATATCAIFDGTWKYISHGFPREFSGVAIDSDGIAYAISGAKHPSVAGTEWRESRYPKKIHNQSEDGYDKGFIANTSANNFPTTVMAALLRTNGKLDTFGIGPTNVFSYALTEYSTSLRFSDVTAGGTSNESAAGCCVQLLDTDNNLHTYGAAASGQCARGRTNDAFSNIGQVQGGAKWSAVFGRNSGGIANRIETFDAQGNRIDPIAPGL